MAGNIEKLGEQRWYLRVFLGRDENGKVQRYNEVFHGSKKDADKRLRDLLRDRDLGKLTIGEKLTLGQYLDQWLETSAKHKLRPRTVGEYTEDLARYVRPTLARIELTKLTALHIQKVWTGMLERGLNPKTVRKSHAILRSALRQAVRWGLIPQNPCQLVDLPKTSHREFTILPRDQVAKFTQACLKHRHGLMLLVGLTTGMRPQEYLGLSWDDVDLSTGEVTIRRVLAWERYPKVKWYWGEPKTSRSRRNLSLPQRLLPLLKAHRTAQLEQRLKVGPAWQDHQLVFANPVGNPWCEWWIAQVYRKILEEAGIARTRLYDLRHSFATYMLEDNVQMKYISEQLGHSTIAITMDVYSHVTPSALQDIAQRMDDLLGQDPT